jgi:hypothetical protein
MFVKVMLPFLANPPTSPPELAPWTAGAFPSSHELFADVGQVPPPRSPLFYFPSHFLCYLLHISFARIFVKNADKGTN